MIDPTDKVAGAGAARMRDAGVVVDIAEGDAERAARRANAGWLTLSLRGRPHVTYKAAVSADGRTASAGRRAEMDQLRGEPCPRPRDARSGGRRGDRERHRDRR